MRREKVVKWNVSVSSVISGYQETKGTAEPPPLIMATGKCETEREREREKKFTRERERPCLDHK